MRDDQNHTSYQKYIRKSLNPGQIAKKRHTPGSETINKGNAGQEKITEDVPTRKQNPMDPNTQQGYFNKEKELPIIGDLYQKRTDDITTNTHKENQANADDKEKQAQNVSTRKRKRRVRIKIKNYSYE